MIEPLRRGEQESITYQTIQARENGSTYPVEVTLQLITSEDGAARFLAIVHDITAVKQAEENIQKFNAPVERRGGRDK
jgi:PAS domain S-box-containing protein